MRRIQNLRKTAKLNKDDRIELLIVDKDGLLIKFEKEIKDKVGASKIEFAKSIKNNYKLKDKFKIREKHFEIALNKK